MSDDLWRLKVAAFLHDPPQKALLLGRGMPHEPAARDLIRRALGADVPDDIWQRAKTGDRIAAAADRIDFPADTQTFWWRRPVLRHPLSGSVFDLGNLAEVSIDPISEQVRREIDQIGSACEGAAEKAFLWLWRGLADELKATDADEAGLGALWDLLPADTRIPQHTIWHHNRIVSALAGALPEPALLVMSIGPVQDFIACARKTRDLWAGSWILSYLAWHGMKVIADRWGPDTILFPELRGQPLVDAWLRHDKGLSAVGQPAPRALATPSLPNRWVSVLPAPDAEDTAKAAATAVKDAWLSLAGDVRHLVGEKGVDVEENRWHAQQDWVEVYWTVHRWPTTPDGTLGDLKRVLDAALGPDDAFDRLLETFERSGKYRPNLGTFYGRLHTLADRAHGSRKALRNFSAAAEPGYKCTLCGEREPLHGASVDSSKHADLVACWRDIAMRLDGGAVEADGRERLCAVCLTKRLAPSVLARTYGVDARFPSTSEMAAATFKLRVLEESTGREGLRRALMAFLEAMPADERLRGLCVPAVSRAAQRLARDSGETNVSRLAEIDGEWLFVETYQSDEALERVGSAKGPMLEKLRSLLHEAESAGIAPPAPYYAILLMDGDRMGQWVAGTHAELPTVAMSLHPDAVASCRDALGQATLEQKRPQSPSLQAALSASLLGFALQVARHVVEERHAGQVVYAGGDDIFVLAPLARVLDLANDLQRAFRDPAFVAGDRVLLGAEALGRSIRGPERGTVHLGMGSGASASAGIAIAHHLHPLPQVLEAARRMEKRAKRDLDRAAFSVALLKRSGEQAEAGAPWRTAGAQETVPLLRELAAIFAERDGLSPRVLGDLERERAGLAVVPLDAWGRRLAYLLRRHTGPRQRERAGGLADDITNLVKTLGERLGGTEAGWSEAAELLALAAFLARYAGR